MELMDSDMSELNDETVNKINKWARKNLERKYRQVLSENRDIRKQRDSLFKIIDKLEKQKKILCETVDFYAAGPRTKVADLEKFRELENES